MTTKHVRIARYNSGPNGCFGAMSDADTGVALGYTVEHTYEVDGVWTPKVPAGNYDAVLGLHQLAHGGPFQTYMLLNVPGHSNILLHQGNTENDSAGCFVMGLNRGTLNGMPAVLQSEACFDAFIAATGGAPRILVSVLDAP